MARAIEFPPFRLDLDAEQLQRGSARVPLRPKAFAVLRHLAARPGRAVSKAELIAAVWPDAHVDAAALKVCVNELRRALGDDARDPAVVETVRGRGYRFRAAIRDDAEPRRLPPWFVGREAEMAALRQALDDAVRGTQRVVVIQGDAGLGKTTLTQAFLAAIDAGGRRDGPRVLCGVGQSAARPGAGDAFQPLIDALAEACRGPDEQRLRDLLRDVAPYWLLHLPGPLRLAEREALRRAVAGTTRAAAIRELAHALRVLGAVRPLVLVLEDLHAADEATHDALAAIARGSDRGHVLVLATLRPTGGGSALGALLHDLARRHRARELSLSPFAVVEVERYLAQRLGPGERATLAETLIAHTGGNPLFVAAVAEHLDGAGASIATRSLARRVPETLRRLLVEDVERLPPAERATLEAAAVAGVTVVAPALAPALGEPVPTVEARLAAMSRQRTAIRADGAARWIDGSAAAVFAFVHAVHRDAVYEQIPPARRADLHARIGASLAAAVAAAGGAEGVHAAELAAHFEQAGDVPRALRYHEAAGRHATERLAHGAAVRHLERALELLGSTGDARPADELRLRTALGPVLMNARGFASPDVAENYARALALCRRAREHPDLFPVLEGLQSHYSINGRLPIAHELSRRMQTLATALDDRAMRVESHHTTGTDLLKPGRPADAVAELDAGLALYDDESAERAFHWCGHDARVCCETHRGVCLWHLGSPAGATRACAAALAHARRLHQPASLAIALVGNAWLRLVHDDAAGARPYLDEAVALATDDDLPYWAASAGIFLGWARTLAGDLDGAATTLHAARTRIADLGSRVLGVEHRLVAAGLALACDRADRALDLLDDADARHAEAGEVYLRGDIALLRGTALALCGAADRPAALAAFVAAMSFGERHGFRPLALRAALRLAACAEDAATIADARAALARACRAFEPACTLPDLLAARTLLAGTAPGA